MGFSTVFAFSHFRNLAFFVSFFFLHKKGNFDTRSRAVADAEVRGGRLALREVLLYWANFYRQFFDVCLPDCNLAR